MNQVFFFKKTRVLFSFLIMCNLYLQGQTPGPTASFINPGNNSCNAGRILDDGYFMFPVPTGLTLGGLNHLETDVLSPEASEGPTIVFSVSVQAPCGPITIYFAIVDPDSPPNPSWINSGNVAAPGSEVTLYDCVAGQTLPYGDVQAMYSSYPVSNIRIQTETEGYNVYFDNTIINNTTYNYDDCDSDGLLDIYDCDPAHGGNNKVLVCHSGQTICVAMPALQAHLDHGDYMGTCITNNRPATIISPEETGSTELKLYPNPAEHQINLRINNNKRLGTVSIYDITGKMIFSYLIGASQAVIDVMHFSPGIYYLRSDQMERVIKFVKQ